MNTTKTTQTANRQLKAEGLADISVGQRPTYAAVNEIKAESLAYHHGTGHSFMRKAFGLCALLGLASGVAVAEPSVKLTRNTFEITEGVTDAVLAKIKEDIGKVNKAELGFELKKIKTADLEKICAAYPGTGSLAITDSKEVDSLAPVAGLKDLRSIKTSGIKASDLTPLAGLTGLTRLDVGGDEFAPDLKWMSGLTKLTYLAVRSGKKLTSFEGLPALPALTSATLSGAEPADLTPIVTSLPNLKSLSLTGCIIKDLTPLTGLAKLDDLSLYGVTVKDFTPLAKCPKLRKLTYYATKDADYATLGTLTQVEELQGGLTKLADISWVEKLPNLKQLLLFSESVKDYSPLAKTKIEHLTIWDMKVPLDLTSLSGAKTLTYLKLWGFDKGVTAFEALGALVNLKELVIEGVNRKEGNVDMAFLKTLASLEQLNLRECKAVNFDAVADCAKLVSVDVYKSTDITSLAPLKKLPALKAVTVKKGTFPDEELSGFGTGVKVNQW